MVIGIVLTELCPVFSPVWQFACIGMDPVRVTVGMSTEHPGSPLWSVDKSLGSPRRSIGMDDIYSPFHGGLGPVARLELLVIMLYRFVCNTRTLENVTLQILR